jgi:hypothetical protein
MKTNLFHFSGAVFDSNPGKRLSASFFAAFPFVYPGEDEVDKM